MTRFTAPTLTGYNASPPPDDGTESTANQLTWAKHKTKLGDPLKTYAEAMATAITAMDGRVYPSGITTAATNLTLTAAAHNGKNVRVTGSSTITLPEAASATTTFRVVITKADSTNTVTINTQNSETIDGASSITLTDLGEAVGLVTDGSNWVVDTRFLADTPLPLNYIHGFTVTRNGSDTDHDLDISAGAARDSDNSVNITSSSTITKQINANWAEGTNQGGFPSGLTLSASTTYKIFSIVDDAGGVDFGFDTSATATNLLADATDYVAYREIGGVSTDASANVSQIWTREDQRPGIAMAITTTSGTGHDFIGVPSWVRRITVVFAGVSLSGTDQVLVQLGDSGGIETSGYASTGNSTASGGVTNASSTAGFIIRTATDGHLLSGTMVLVHIGSNVWVSEHNGKVATTNAVHGGGDKTLSATLDRVRITRTGTDTFDAGSVNILYE